MSLNRYWSPFRGFLVSPPFRQLYVARPLQRAAFPAVSQAFAHINNRDNKVELSVEVPGMKVEDLKVIVCNRMLTISGNRNVSTDNKTSTFNFMSEFALDTAVDVDNLTANLNKGVLTITAPKAAINGPKKIEITEKTNLEDPDEFLAPAREEELKELGVNLDMASDLLKEPFFAGSEVEVSEGSENREEKVSDGVDFTKGIVTPAFDDEVFRTGFPDPPKHVLDLEARMAYYDVSPPSESEVDCGAEEELRGEEDIWRTTGMQGKKKI